jgi:DNA replication ATP-dependent helicase Dna2
MSAEIMAFPNVWFYDGQLRVLDLPAPADLPVADLPPVVFLPVPVGDTALPHAKTNRAEAELAVQLVRRFRIALQQAGQPWHPAKTLGIITPWRAQIAQIRAALTEAGENPDDITIDTVERYQGGARDIIIVSTCVNNAWQLQSLVNLSREGVDRKLNVALTRARRYVAVIGNEDILRLDERYRAFIDEYRFIL